VHRADGSGSSFTLADHLSKVSPEWKARVGASTMIQWPTGVGVRHGSGVAESVARIRGAIGYVDYASAVWAKLAHALVQNQAGQFVTPGLASFEAATADVDWAREQDFAITLTNGAAADAYPIMAISFAVTRHTPKDAGRARAMRAFPRWALANRQEQARALSFVPLPTRLIEQLEGYGRVESR
jgi:phosphate transport system substrate-binding protein